MKDLHDKWLTEYRGAPINFKIEVIDELQEKIHKLERDLERLHMLLNE